MKYVLIFVMLFSYNTLAQIIFNISDISLIVAPGNSTTVFVDTLATTINIGQLGSTSWDFSSLVNNAEVGPVLAVDPATTPYFGNYPGSNIGSKATDTETTIYSYFSVNNSSFDRHGMVTESQVQGIPTTLMETLNPIEPTEIFPFTFGSTIEYNGEKTVVQEISGLPPFTIVSTVVNNRVVDAYGPMTLPSGRVVDALRIKQDLIEIWQDPFPFRFRQIIYSFVTKDGSQVNVISDTTKPEIGVINLIVPVSWNDALVTSVRVEKTIPKNLSLRQNYPNPFNPTTKIEYSIPSESFVVLKVYDVLGNEVATLVNEQQQAGVYRADFNAENLPSGMYFARITANEFTQVIKMTLLK